MSIDSLFGVAEQALRIASRRADLLANNLANASTPNFKARDLDFQQALQEALNNDASSTAKSTVTNNDELSGAMRYRVPVQASLDGNTVDPDVERSKFMENAMDYQLNLTFIKSTAARLQKALQGE